jgi:hypothetical protein
VGDARVILAAVEGAELSEVQADAVGAILAGRGVKRSRYFVRGP